MKFLYTQLFIWLVLFYQPSYSVLVDPSFIHRTDSIIALDTADQITLIESRKEEHRIFQSMTVKTVNHPYDKVSEMMVQWYKYVPNIKYMRRAIPILLDSTDTEPKLIFVEIGVWFAVSLSLGEISVNTNLDSTETIVRLDQVDKPDIFKKMKREAKGLFKVEYHNFITWYKLIDLGDGKSRLALVSIVEPKIWIPKWLNNSVSKRVFPGMICDIEALLDQQVANKIDTQK